MVNHWICIFLKKNQTVLALKRITKFLLSVLFKLGNKVFKQVIGIPTRSNPAPFLTNLFDYFCENKWINKIKKTYKKHSENAFRFIDELHLMTVVSY